MRDLGGSEAQIGFNDSVSHTPALDKQVEGAEDDYLLKEVCSACDEYSRTCRGPAFRGYCKHVELAREQRIQKD